MEKATKKIGSIIVAFKPEIGNSGALAFEKQLREYLKQKNLLPLQIQRVFSLEMYRMI